MEAAYSEEKMLEVGEAQFGNAPDGIDGREFERR
jgi:hypothetical protein